MIFNINADVREKPADGVDVTSSAFGAAHEFASSVVGTGFVLLRRFRRLSRNTITAMITVKASEPPTAPPITVLENLLGLAAAVAVDVLLALVDVLLAVENAVGSGIEEESATFRSWK